MKPTLYSEVLDKETLTERAVLVGKQREYIKTHLDLLGLKYDAVVVTLIREQLNKDYRAIDVAVAYGKVYRSKHDCVELYKNNNPNRYSFSDEELALVRECVQLVDSEHDLPTILAYDLKKTLGIIK